MENEKMEKKFPTWARIISSIIVFFSSIGIYATVSSAGKEMIEYGNEMARLRSQSGTSVAEHYYQLHGEIYAALGSAIANGIAVVLIVGIAITLWLIYPVIVEHKSQIKNKAIELKDTTQRVAQAISNEAANAHTKKIEPVTTDTEESNTNKLFCTQCGAAISAGTVFCTQCGHKTDSSSKG